MCSVSISAWLTSDDSVESVPDGGGSLSISLSADNVSTKKQFTDVALDGAVKHQLGKFQGQPSLQFILPAT